METVHGKPTGYGEDAYNFAMNFTITDSLSHTLTFEIDPARHSSVGVLRNDSATADNPLNLLTINVDSTTYPNAQVTLRGNDLEDYAFELNGTYAAEVSVTVKKIVTPINDKFISDNIARKTDINYIGGTDITIENNGTNQVINTIYGGALANIDYSSDTLTGIVFSRRGSATSRYFETYDQNIQDTLLEIKEAAGVFEVPVETTINMSYYDENEEQDVTLIDATITGTYIPGDDTIYFSQESGVNEYLNSMYRRPGSD